MEFSAKSTEKYFLSIFAKKSQHKPKVNWVLSPLRLLMWRTKLNWIQTGASEGFLVEAYEIKTTYYIHKYCFFIKGNLYWDQIQTHSITLSFSTGKQSFFYYWHWFMKHLIFTNWSNFLSKIFENKLKSIFHQSEKLYLDLNAQPKIQILNGLYSR